MTKLTEYQKAALAYNKHISLTANAGSGKTTVLAKRFVEILVNEKISINNIVAITFTEKAASELYSKIANELDQRIIDSAGSNNFRLESIRRSLVSANISTIHSFCIDILKDYAPEAGIDANFSPIDSRTSEELLDQSIDEIITFNLNNESTNVKNLIRIFSSKSQLVTKTKQLFNKRKTTEQLVGNFYDKKTDEIANYFSEKFVRKFSELFETTINNLINDIEIINAIAGNYKVNEKQIEISRILNEIKPLNSLIEKYILLVDISKVLLTQKGDVIKRGLLSPKLYEENLTIIEEISNLFGELGSVEISKDYEKLNLYLADFGKNVSQFYNEINERYTLKKQLKSYLDFEDLLLLTQKLLENIEVQNNLSEKYKYIMIDEYQDTNETQYNIFMPILKNLTKGNLFVVGDEKQSIYMFREAEVELFYQTQKEFKGKGNPGILLDLPHSFRLAPKIALFTNVLFRSLFANPKAEFNEVCYSDLVCAYPNKEMGKVEFLLAKEDEISEAELVTRKIIKIVDEPNSIYSLGDIAVLCTKRKNFVELEKALSDYQIPFNIVGGKGFYQQQLILDIYNYISFLINPKNDLALATILRAPYYSLSDVELTKISLKKGSDLFSKLKGDGKYDFIVTQLNKHLHLAKVLQTSELIRRINNDTGYWAYLSSKQNGNQEIANLKKLIQKAIKINEQGFHSLYDFAVYLKDAINNLADEGQAELDVGNNAVKIMTIHQAKGLEFKVVFLFKTNQKPFDESLKSKDIIVDKSFGILSKLPVGNNYFDPYQPAPLIGIYNYIQKMKSNAELKRLLYVAITRAEQYLIISTEIKKDKVLPGSFASMIFDALTVDFNIPEIELTDEITFMRFNQDRYELKNEILKLKIESCNYIEKPEVKLKAEDIIEGNTYNIYHSSINSYEKNEIISASKISLFLNCPKKYELTYEFGYGELTRLFRDEIDFEFNDREDESNLHGNIVGSIIHSILEKGVSVEYLEEAIDGLLIKDPNTVLLSNEKINLLKNDVRDIVNHYYQSASYQKLCEYQNYSNEVEFYLKENDYYLYGIIDKLVVTNSKIIVVDYKSDKVNNKNINEKKDTYLNQLLFYSYIMHKKYPNVKEYELRLIFLRDDNFSYIQKVNQEEIQSFGKVIANSVIKIREKKFNEFTEGCKNMKYYYLDN